MLNEMLMTAVVPRLRSAARSIPKIGCEDDEEIAADCTLMAAKMMDSAEKAGRSFTASTIAYYTERAARSGRRTYYSGRSDVYSAGCQLDGNARHKSLDDEIEFETGEFGTCHDIVSPFDQNAHEADPAQSASRNIDWQSFLESHPPRYRTALCALVAGETMREAGKRCGLKDSAALTLRRRIAADLVEFFGEDAIQRLLHGMRPAWDAGLQASRHRRQCQTGLPATPEGNQPCPVR
jgi:hypothetical protein